MRLNQQFCYSYRCDIPIRSVLSLGQFNFQKYVPSVILCSQLKSFERLLHRKSLYALGFCLEFQCLLVSFSRVIEKLIMEDFGVRLFDGHNNMTVANQVLHGCS